MRRAARGGGPRDEERSLGTGDVREECVRAGSVSQSKKSKSKKQKQNKAKSKTNSKKKKQKANTRMHTERRAAMRTRAARG